MKAELSKEAMEQKMAEGVPLLPLKVTFTERKLADYKIQQETKEVEKRVAIEINAKKEASRLLWHHTNLKM